MGTNFSVKQTNKSKTPTGHYEMEREWKKEARKIAELEKELKAKFVDTHRTIGDFNPLFSRIQIIGIHS